MYAVILWVCPIVGGPDVGGVLSGHGTEWVGHIT